MSNEERELVKQVVENMVPSIVRPDHEFCVLNVETFERAFVGNYICPGGQGRAAIGNRYEDFREFMKRGIPVKAPQVYIAENGRVEFLNGRHRYAVLRDLGAQVIKVSMDRESYRHAERYGYVVGSRGTWDSDAEARAAREEIERRWDQEETKRAAAARAKRSNLWIARAALLLVTSLVCFTNAGRHPVQSVLVAILLTSAVFAFTEWVQEEFLDE